MRAGATMWECLAEEDRGLLLAAGGLWAVWFPAVQALGCLIPNRPQFLLVIVILRARVGVRTS